MRVIALNGGKQSGKWRLANTWGRNENVSYISPYTDSKKRPQDFKYLKREDLLKKCEDEPPVVDTMINGHHYCYFASQLINDYNILIVDDLGLKDLVDKLPFNIPIVTVFVNNSKAEPSERVGVHYSSSDYDYIFNVEGDDPDLFLEQLAFDVEMVQ